jgi:hypothetical protein
MTWKPHLSEAEEKLNAIMVREPTPPVYPIYSTVAEPEHHKIEVLSLRHNP